MKRIFLIASLAFTGFLNAQDVIEPIATGSTIPLKDLKMKSVNGVGYSVKEVCKKKGVLVMFSCNTCPVVVKYQSRTLDVIR